MLDIFYSVISDPYLNTDAGTMSPFEHGEVFVLDDGGEVYAISLFMPLLFFSLFLSLFFSIWFLTSPSMDKSDFITLIISIIVGVDCR